MTQAPNRPSLAVLVQGFFCDRLIQQQNLSAHTVASYRDTFRLLLQYCREHRKKSPEKLKPEDLDAPIVLAFLEDLERRRGNSIRTRNTRLAAVHSFMKYVQTRDPSLMAVAQRVLAIPVKRFHRPLLGYLSQEEVTAVIAAPSRDTWSGRRDRMLLTMLYNTGARVSEAIALRRMDVTLSPTRSVRFRGKGRKERQVPLWKTTAASLTDWLTEIDSSPETPLFPNRHGRALSRSGVEDRLCEAVAAALPSCPSLRGKNVSPHTMRHTTAMHLLQSGVDISVIALWLGHQSSETTHQYIEADLAMKQRALARVDEPSAPHGRFQAKGDLLRFLDSL
jgi:integrase/recombinase XerD